MLRFDAPVQALRRRTVVPTTVRGVDLPANATISLVYGSANRDERNFDDPDTYSLDRDARRHLSFSAGIHFCPGAPVTRFEVRALIDEMLDRYVRIERVAPSQRWPIDQKTVEAMRGLRSVPLRFVR